MHTHTNVCTHAHTHELACIKKHARTHRRDITDWGVDPQSTPAAEEPAFKWCRGPPETPAGGEQGWRSDERGGDNVRHAVELLESDQLCEAMLGARNEAVWRSKLSAAHALLVLSRLREAEELCASTLGLMVDGAAPLPLIARAQTELATVLARQNRLQESLECYERAAQLHGAAPSPLVPGSRCRLARLRAAMGEVHERREHYGAALKQYQLALGLYEGALGGWHARVGAVLVATAGACQRLGLWEQALAHYLRAKSVFTVALGREHVLLAEVHNSVGAHFAQAADRASYLRAIQW